MEAQETTSAVDPPTPAASEWGGLLDFAVGDDEDGTLFPPWTIDAFDSPMPPLPPLRPIPPSGDGLVILAREVGDPMSLCSNYPAGRLPCSCPELDEAATGNRTGGERKRPRNARAARVAALPCQVTGCEADIGELKGYHRRHRVCFRCARASSVVLDGENKRYCQQCGKFHILTDFDEGKRSCRRKLERHNKRRRRRNTGIHVVEKDEKPLGVLHANVSSVDLSHRDFKKIGTIGMESTVSKVLALDTIRHAAQYQFAPRPTLDRFASRNDERVVRSKQIKRKVPFGSEDDGYESSFSLLGGFVTTQRTSLLSLAASDETPNEEKADNLESSISSTHCNSKGAYSSACPTGRLSFKLYDWNPEEFPKQLRLQVFKWLSSMPVELEGYIRPGCILLTMFIAMPDFMWEKLTQDVVTRIQDLIYAQESLLVGRGNIHIFLPDTIVQILKDQISSVSTRVEVQIPRLHHVYPTFFEAGQPVKFIACGSNLRKTKFRFLVSFAGKYLELNSCPAVSPSERKPSEVHDMDPTCHCGHEMFRINIPRTDPDILGPAFIEVENELGISNFIPIVITNNRTYSEFERLHKAFCDRDSVDGIYMVNDIDATSHSSFGMKKADLSELLLDIAWVLQNPEMEKREQLLSMANVQRLTKLLVFLLQIQSSVLLEVVLDYLEKIQRMNLKCESSNTLGESWVLLLRYINQAREVLSQGSPHDMRSKSDSEICSGSSCSSQSCGEEDMESNVLLKNQGTGNRNEDVLGTATENNEVTALLGGASERDQSWTYRTRISVSWGKNLWRNNTVARKADKYVTLAVAVCAIMCLVVCLTLVCGSMS